MNTKEWGQLREIWLNQNKYEQSKFNIWKKKSSKLDAAAKHWEENRYIVYVGTVCFYVTNFVLWIKL